MRKRSTNPRIPIHVTLKRSTIDRLDKNLKHNQSRSKYIDIAILEKLNGFDELERLDSKDMLFELMFRGVIKHGMYNVLVESISEDA